MKPEFLFSFVCEGIADIKNKKTYLGVAHYFSSPEYPATFENYMFVSHWLLGTIESREIIKLLDQDGKIISQINNPIPIKTDKIKTLERILPMLPLNIKRPCRLTVEIFLDNEKIFSYPLVFGVGTDIQENNK